MGGLFSAQEEPPRQTTSYQQSPVRSYENASIYSYNRSTQEPQRVVRPTATWDEAPRQNISSRQSTDWNNEYIFRSRTQEPRRVVRETFDNYFEDRLVRDIQGMVIGVRASLQTRTIQPAEKSKINDDLFLISSTDYYSPTSVVTFHELPQYDPEYSTVYRMITNKKNFKVDSIEKIVNPYLEKAYELKKAQKKLEYRNLEEHLLFHGTTRNNIDTICKMNFDWRCCKAHKYGKGVSFSINCNYASNYSEQHVHNKVMIVAKVLIGNSCIGNKFMELPEKGCDTSLKDFGNIVVVKYEDNEFCPVYKINYHLIDENLSRGVKNQRKGGRRQVFHNINDFDLFFD